MSASSLVGALRSVVPESGEFQFITKNQYRALKPTWPVAFSLLFLSLAFLVSDQGRAIIRFTAERSASDFGLNWSFLITVFFFVTYGAVMMYTAFMLSAVTRRSQLDKHSSGNGPNQQDPVDSSINLRWHYAYACGVFLPMQFLIMSMWFRTDFFSGDFIGVALIGLAAILGFRIIANTLYVPVASSLAQLTRESRLGGRHVPYFKRAEFSFFRLIQLAIVPEHRLAQSAIVGIGVMLVALAVIVDDPDTGFIETLVRGGAVFYVTLIVLHLLYRFAQRRVVKMHQGHTARYIIIAPKAVKQFNRIRRILLIAIPALLWWPHFVNMIGPLSVGLFGTLWLTLLFSGFIESAASQAKKIATTGEPPELTWRSWLFILLVALMAIELVLGICEAWIYESQVAYFEILVLVSVGFFLYWLRDRMDGIVTGINSLPSPSLIAPIFALSLGEAHHVHRIAYDPAGTEVYEIHDHAQRWIEAQSREGSDVTAIVILAEGGGIRAGAHAGLFLSHLDTRFEKMCEENTGTAGNEDANADPVAQLCAKGGRLLDHVYSINGVSGGSVGSAVYLAAVNEEVSHSMLSPNRLRCKENDESGTRYASPEDQVLNRKHQKACNRHDIIFDTLSSDYLSPLFAGLFGSDVPTTIVPVQLPERIAALSADSRRNTDFILDDSQDDRGVPDRADFFEHRIADVFNSNLKDALETDCDTAGVRCDTGLDDDQKQTLDRSLENVARGSVRSGGTHPGPMVFFSTFYETGGIQMATSNVDVYRRPGPNNNTDYCGSVPIVQQMLDKQHADDNDQTTFCRENDIAKIKPGRMKTLPLSTAAHLSARFPVSNPTGVIETRSKTGTWKRHFFVDGGYMDNSGALTAIQSVDALKAAAHNTNTLLNVVVIHIYALSIPDEANGKAGSSAGKQATKQSEFAAIPSAILKARGASSRAPIRMLCHSLQDNSDPSATEKCDEIFRRRTVTAKEAENWYSRDHFAEAIAKSKPTMPQAYFAIPLQRIQGDDENPSGIRNSTWIPVPLEVASSDKQDNAITALLGWTLLRQTSEGIDRAMYGAADIVFDQYAKALSHSELSEPTFADIEFCSGSSISVELLDQQAD